jgi:hypothetical protein
MNHPVNTLNLLKKKKDLQATTLTEQVAESEKHCTKHKRPPLNSHLLNRVIVTNDIHRKVDLKLTKYREHNQTMKKRSLTKRCQINKTNLLEC